MKIAEKLEFVGDFSSSEFCEWVQHRADRLGLVGWVRVKSQQKIETVVCGEPELIDAMEVACSLGPFSATVEAINRTPYARPNDLEKCEEFNLRAEC